MTGMSMMPKTTGSQSPAHVCTATTSTVDSSLVSSGTTVSVSQSTDVHTVSSLAVSAEPFVPPGLNTYSNALMTRPPPPSHGMHIGDTDQFPQLPVQQMAALAQQLQVPSGASANISNNVTTNGSGSQPTTDGFKMANINKMARKMSTMRITGRATGCGLRAAPAPSDDVFAKNFHKDTTEQELFDYLNTKNIMPKSVQTISHEQSRTKSFKICCDRENFV